MRSFLLPDLNCPLGGRRGGLERCFLGGRGRNGSGSSLCLYGWVGGPRSFTTGDSDPQDWPRCGDGRPIVKAHRRMNATEFERFLLGERGGAEVF